MSVQTRGWAAILDRRHLDLWFNNADARCASLAEWMEVFSRLRIEDLDDFTVKIEYIGGRRGVDR